MQPYVWPDKLEDVFFFFFCERRALQENSLVFFFRERMNNDAWYQAKHLLSSRRKLERKKKKEPKKESLSLFLSRTKCENKNGELFSLTILPLRYLHAIEILYIFFFILFLAFGSSLRSWIQ